MILVTYVLLGFFLMVDGLNRIGVTFQGDGIVKGILLLLSGLFIVLEYL